MRQKQTANYYIYSRLEHLLALQMKKNQLSKGCAYQSPLYR